VPGAAALHLLTIDGAGQLQIVGVVELVRGDQPGAHRSEARTGLAEAELGSRPGHLDDALRDVLADRQARDVTPGIGFGHPVRVAADDHHQFHLPVGVAALRQCHLGHRAGDAGRVLGEDRWHALGRGESRLGDVLAVVQADGEQLTGRR
jgi:hypothetical protein